MFSGVVMAGTSAHVDVGAIVKLPVPSSGGCFSTATASAGGLTISAAGALVAVAWAASAPAASEPRTTTPPRIPRAVELPATALSISLVSSGLLPQRSVRRTVPSNGRTPTPFGAFIGHARGILRAFVYAAAAPVSGGTDEW